MIPVARNVWQQVEGGRSAAAARRLIIARTRRRESARPVRRERRAGHRDPDPGEPGLADRGDDPGAARRLAADGGPCPGPAELAQEVGARQGQDVPGPAGAEGRHQGGGAARRDAEEPVEIAAGEEGAVQRRELADGVGDGEQPAGLRGHPSTLLSLGGR